MRFEHRDGRERDAGIDMTPMMDIVFIMLIFFVLTASFTQTQTLAFESPAIAAAGLPMPKYEIGRPTVDRVMTVPDFSFESPAAPAAAAPSAPAVSSIALARPVHRVPPQYPVKAKQQGIEGYVVMDLRINAEGRVEDVRVVREKPEGVFRASALRVVRRWAFMPPAEPAWQRLTIRYELEK